jgi:hypothetical protein
MSTLRACAHLLAFGALLLAPEAFSFQTHRVVGGNAGVSTSEIHPGLASNPEDIPITPAQIAEIERRLENTVRTPILGLLGKKLRQEFWDRMVDGAGCPSRGGVRHPDGVQPV